MCYHLDCWEAVQVNIYWVDEKVLNAFERFSHLMQRTFGAVAADWERAAYFVALVQFLVKDFASDISKHKSITWDIILFIAWSVSGLATHWMHNRHSPDGFINSSRIRYRMLRSLCLVANIVWFWMMFRERDFCFLCITAAWYFEAVTDLPPGESKVRKFINSFRSAPRTVEVGV